VVHGEDGQVLGLVDVDGRTVRDEPDLVAGVLDSARMGFENARLDAHLSAQIIELEASRARIVTAAGNERREVQRQLVDGPGRRLRSAERALALVCSHDDVPQVCSDGRREVGGGAAGDAVARTRIAAARTHVQQGLTDLRELARGVYPVLLGQGGLGPALRALPEESGLPVRLSVSDAGAVRLRPAVEYTAYSAVTEWVSRSGQMRASKILVDVDIHPDAVEIWAGVARSPDQERTDGRGGSTDAVLDALPGLSSAVRDRILAVGGSCEAVRQDGRDRAGLHISIPVIP
jgi:signal transduction histidine kinase